MFLWSLVALVVTADWSHGQTDFPPTTLPPTTSPEPTTAPGSCVVEQGVVIANGTYLEKDPNNCHSTQCVNGALQYFDHQCWLNPPPCYGVEERIDGQCCKLCHTTPTTVPTTTPRVPPGGCDYEGSIFFNGANITWHPCGGLMCMDGQIIAWDHKCAFSTPPCFGTSINDPDQCCPICLNNFTTTSTTPSTAPVSNITSSTTTTTTTGPPPDGCLYNGDIYQNYDTVEVTQGGCYVKECHYGTIRGRDMPCKRPGVLPCPPHRPVVRKDADCCPVCDVTTTTTTTTTTASEVVCRHKGETYDIGSRMNDDPCNPCICGLYGKRTCQSITCPVLDCKVRQKPQGTCCYSCSGSSKAVPVWTPLVVLAMLQRGVGLFQ